MKNVKLLLQSAIVAALTAACCGQEETCYTVKILGVKLVDYNPRYMDVSFDDFTLDGQNVINHTMHVYEDLPMNTRVKVLLYAYFQKQYHSTAMNFRGTLCDFIDGDYSEYFYKQFKKFGNYWPLECPLKKGFYHLTNWYITKEIPFPNLMRGMYLGFDSGMFDVQFAFKSDVLLHFKLYLQANGTGFGLDS